ncbi:EEF1A lysine methyltransferase 3 isoform X2 [Macadamia integrifolia]|uniref:EEF1A lysine methyltransferase 3 isoform X2 n=1 Tax=Macadamia integrifolia TaxID=60698 RepID=UPI001C4ECABA|nr:EEF1A lysine methyltransferase 3 isoform X2 [Macadamia integrifolia]
MDIALFSPSSLFAGDDDDDSTTEEETVGTHQSYEERSHEFPGMDLLIREFSFHQLNANLLWPGTFAFAEWLLQNCSWLEGRRIIELGSGTGALAIFLQKSLGVDITTSDFDDEEVEENIAHNCRINGITPVLPHIRYTWGDKFPKTEPDWDLVIASDILLYVKQYPNLIKTLSFLLNSYKPKDEKAEIDLSLPQPTFLMSWRRRIGKEDEELFFNGCENAGLAVKHVGSRVYCISPRQTSQVDQ